MALETGTYIDDLVATNPTAGDLKSQGDDHLRLIKSALKSSFPNIAGVVTLTHGQLSGVDTPLSGTPTAPTAAAANNSTQIATTAYVDATFVAEAYPPVSGNDGKFLTNDGNITSWETVDIASALIPYYTKVEIDANTYTQTAADVLLALKAPLASPTLTGTPIAPTAVAGTDTTQIATTAFATTADNLKADLASPALTGTPTAPTAASGTDTTQIATTAFVLANGLYDAYVKVVDEKTQDTPGGTFTDSAWQVRDIAEEEDTKSIASVTANVLTLAAGTYRCAIKCPTYAVGTHQARLYDSTGARVLVLGTSENGGASGASVSNSSVIAGRFTLTVESELEVQHQCGTTVATVGFGNKANLGVEVYTIGEFWREV